MPQTPKWIRSSFILLSMVMLLATYLFQRTNWVALFLPSADFHPYVVFILNKTCRLVVNDLACFLLIFALFQDKRYLKLAWWLFLFELLILLPVYFIIKLTLEGDSEISSPLLSQVHRLIVNPMLMILLMLGFFYQRSKNNT
jgi:exosortase F-associated protein